VRMRQWHGIVGSRFAKREVLLPLTVPRHFQKHAFPARHSIGALQFDQLTATALDADVGHAVAVPFERN